MRAPQSSLNTIIAKPRLNVYFLQLLFLLKKVLRLLIERAYNDPPALEANSNPGRRRRCGTQICDHPKPLRFLFSFTFFFLHSNNLYCFFFFLFFNKYVALIELCAMRYANLFCNVGALHIIKIVIFERGLHIEIC